MMNEEDCKGCLGLDLIEEKCNLWSRLDVCPCQKCLVKVMCNDDCDKFTFALYGEENE
jgi:hypothetical protein